MKYTVLKQEKEFLKLALASGINRFGDSIDALALTWLVYSLSGNAMYSAFNFGINFLPTILFAPFAGAFVEKRNKKRLMAFSDLMRACLVFILISLYFLQFLNVYIIMLITFMISSLETLRVPSSTSMIASTICKEKYDIAQSFHTSLTKSLEIIGMGIAGIFLNTGGMIFTFIIDGCAFLISSYMIFHIHVNDPLNIDKQSTLSLFKEGFYYTKTKPALMALCVIACCINAFLVPINAFSSALSVEVFHSGPQIVSILNMSISIGTILGSFIYPYISPLINAKRMIQSLFLSTSCFYILSIFIASLTSIMIQYLCLIVLSILFGIVVISTTMFSQIMVLEKVNPDYLSRFSAMMNALSVSTVPFISFFFSFISTFFSIQNIFIFTGIFVMIVGGILLYNSIDEVIDHDEKNCI